MHSKLIWSTLFNFSAFSTVVKDLNQKRRIKFYGVSDYHFIDVRH